MDENAEIIEPQAVNFVELTADLVSAYVSKNSVRPGDLPDLLASIHGA
ncbi:MucR family transcriptional regulator, partial [Methylobacterium sp. WL7]